MKDIKKDLIYDKKRLYLDFTASGLLHKDIEKKIRDIAKTYANTHSEVSFGARKTSFYYNSALESLKKSLELDSDFYLFQAGNGATGAIKKFQEIIGVYIPPVTKNRIKNIEKVKKPLVIIGPFEHHSNEISYREGLCDIVRIPLNKKGTIDLKFLENILGKNKKREIIGSFSAASNVTGILNPIKKIYKLIKKHNGILAVDGASISAHQNVDCKYYDALFLSPHKLIGGPGSSGILVLRKELYNKNTSPTFAGGGVVDYVSKTEQIYVENVENRESAGTPGILQFIRSALVYEFRNEIGLENIANQEEKLANYFLKQLEKVEDVVLYAKNIKEKVPIFSFNIKNVSPYEISKILSEKFKIETRAGCSCAGPYGHDLLKLKDGFYKTENVKNFGWLRIGFTYIHTKEDVDYFIKSLKKAIINLKNK